MSKIVIALGGNALGKTPQEQHDLIEKAVKGMLQHNTLGAQQFNKLKVYVGPEHPHAAQKPIVIEKEAK